MDILSYSNIDYFILVISLLSWLFFIFLWLEKLHRFYFGVIIWFILFIIVNLHIKLLDIPTTVLKNIIIPESSFLLSNKSFILSFLTFLIPVFWFVLLLSDFISFKVSDNKLASFLFWLFFPFFFISILVYVFFNSAVSIGFIKDFFGTFSDSVLMNYFMDNSYLALYLLFFVIFFRLLFWVIISFLIYFSKQFYSSYKVDKKEHSSHHDNTEEESFEEEKEEHHH